jgi:thiol-disulfide isomerase/thioredoxin
MRAIAHLLGLAGLVASATNMPLHASADTTTHNDSPVLIYIYSPECGACRQFDREVGPIYEKTAESLALPLERVLIDEWQADRHQLVKCASAEVIGTPTFLQIRNCQELDRITGYSDAELFWLGHRRMMNRIASEQ